MCMNSQVVFTVNAKTKARAMQRAKREGVPFASVLKFATKEFAEGRLSVGIIPERFNEKTAKEVREALRDIEQGKNILSFKSDKAMDKYLLKR